MSRSGRQGGLAHRPGHILLPEAPEGGVPGHLLDRHLGLPLRAPGHRRPARPREPRVLGLPGRPALHHLPASALHRRPGQGGPLGAAERLSECQQGGAKSAHDGLSEAKGIGAHMVP